MKNDRFTSDNSSESQQYDPMKRWWVKIILIVVIFWSLPLIYLLVERIRGEVQLHAARERIRSKHQPLSTLEIVPKAVADDQNAGYVLSQIKDEFKERRTLITKVPQIQFTADGHAVPPRLREDWQGDKNEVITWSYVEKELSDVKPLLEKIREASKKEGFDTHVNYTNGYSDLEMPLLVTTKNSVRLFEFSIENELRLGETEMARQDLILMVRLVAHHQREPLLISQLVRIACVSITINSTWSALQSPEWTDSDLGKLDAAWSECDLQKDMLSALLMEQTMNMEQFALLKKSSIAREKFMGGFDSEYGFLGFEPATKGWVFHWINVPLWRFVWLEQDEARALSQWAHPIDLGDRALTLPWNEAQKLSGNGSNKAEDDDGNGFSVFNKTSKDTETPWLVRFRFLLSSQESIVSYKSAVRKAALYQTDCAMVRTAIAIKRFQLKEGTLPKDLKDLVPAFLPAVPMDRMDGKPLRYQPGQNGEYLLYSVGKDGEDNQGDPWSTSKKKEKLSMWSGRDVVWPMPAVKQK